MVRWGWGLVMPPADMLGQLGPMPDPRLVGGMEQRPPPTPPQLLGTLPFSAPDVAGYPAVDSAHRVYAPPPAKVAPPAQNGRTYSSRVVHSVDRTQPTGSGMAAPIPVVANDGPDPLASLMAGLAGEVSTVATPAGSRAFVGSSPAARSLLNSLPVAVA